MAQVKMFSLFYVIGIVNQNSMKSPQLKYTLLHLIILYKIFILKFKIIIPYIGVSFIS